MEKGFALDIMLGRLCKWLRVMGFDAIILPFNRVDVRSLCTLKRTLITRRRGPMIPGMIVLKSEVLSLQLAELKELIGLNLDPKKAFTRCIRCNEELVPVLVEEVPKEIPEYIRLTQGGNISFCRRCKGIFWPGSHRKNMESQLRSWGFV